MAILINNNGSPLPIYQTDENRLYFLTIFPIHPDFNKSKLLVTQLRDSEKSRSRSEFYVHKKKVLAFCKKKPHTTKMLAEKLKRHPRVVYRSLIKPLLEQELLQPVHSNPNAPNQAYTAVRK